MQLDFRRDETIEYIEMLQQNIGHLNRVNSVLRKEIHDFSNHLQVILSLCMKRNETTIDDIKHYVQGISGIQSKEVYFCDSGCVYVDGLLAVKSNAAFQKNIHWEANFEKPLTVIGARETDLVALLGNLIDNAFEAMRQAGTQENGILSILGYVEDGRYIISVSNTGSYIPLDLREKIFLEGYSTKAEKSDHGLGLSIVTQMMSRYGGKIEVRSDDFETEFIVAFPL